MKIALIGSKDYDSLEYHINDSLTFLGHEVFHIDIKDVIRLPYRYNYWAVRLFPKYDAQIFKRIADKVIEQKPDLVIATYRFIHPDCIRAIKENLSNVKAIHINPDALTTFEHQQVFASPYDAFFTKDHYIVHFMRDKMKLNAFYLPEALNARVHKPLDRNREEIEKEIDIDVTAFGTMYPYRAKMVSELIKAGVNVSLFGVPDKRFPLPEITKNFRNEYITGNRKAEVLYGSKIIFNNFHYAEIESANAKFFEINGIGGFQLCDYRAVLKEYSAIDVEKVTFVTIDEAIEKVKYYLTHPQERYNIAKTQMQHFHNNHTYEHRMKYIFEMINSI
ncbi:glycosyltransferase [Taibaiella lutea]|uniref:Glycosyltransferase n=1 Tax=Taibaiella lutea TaxID=2608001 RepID=A0A5M6CF25_9BACT|nr:glycosyltransferase [Taibaiella lutea]KAA5533774.1 glycosyltransferase [Taibaiella lutea]